MLIQKDKIGQKGAWPRSRDLLFKFWDPPLISVELPMIQTSNFACRLILRDTEPLRGVFTTRRYTNPRLHLPQPTVKSEDKRKHENELTILTIVGSCTSS